MRVTANVTRSGDWWAIEVPEVPGVYTQAKRLEQVREMVADAVALMAGVKEADVEVDVRPHISAHVDAVVAKAREVSSRAAQVEAQAAALKREAVALLRHDEHLTVRDVGALLDVSPQRVSQLEHA